MSTTRAEILASFMVMMGKMQSELSTNGVSNYGLDYRQKFNGRLKKAAEIGLSKHNPVEVGNTRFGKTKLLPVCLACDRPFGVGGRKNLSPSEPCNEGVPPPNQNVNATRTQTAIDRSNNVANAKKHIIRGGFRMPKSASSPLLQQVEACSARVVTCCTLAF
jgi:hypothetical protein